MVLISSQLLHTSGLYTVKTTENANSIRLQQIGVSAYSVQPPSVLLITLYDWKLGETTTLANLKINHMLCRQVIYVGVIKHDHCPQADPVPVLIMVTHVTAITALTHPRDLVLTYFACIIPQQSAGSLAREVAVNGKSTAPWFGYVAVIRPIESSALCSYASTTVFV